MSNRDTFQKLRTIIEDAFTAMRDELGVDDDDAPTEEVDSSYTPPRVPAPPPAEKTATWPSGFPRVRDVARVALRDAVESFEACGERAIGSHPDSQEGQTLDAFGELSARTGRAAKVTIVQALLLLWGDITSLEECDADDFEWGERGGCVEERFVWASPGTDADGDVVYDLDQADVQLFDLCNVENLDAGSLCCREYEERFAKAWHLPARIPKPD